MLAWPNWQGIYQSLVLGEIQMAVGMLDFNQNHFLFKAIFVCMSMLVSIFSAVGWTK